MNGSVDSTPSREPLLEEVRWEEEGGEAEGEVDRVAGAPDEVAGAGGAGQGADGVEEVAVGGVAVAGGEEEAERVGRERLAGDDEGGGEEGEDDAEAEVNEPPEGDERAERERGDALAVGGLEGDRRRAAE